MSEELKAMILAAGYGTRLRPYTETLPKALYPVAGRPMIHYPLLWLKRWGFNEVIVNTHYLAEMIERELGDGSALGIRVRYSREEILLGTGGGIGRARRMIGRSPMLVLNADTIVDVDLEELLARRKKADAVAVMAVVEERPGGYTPLALDGEGMVRAIGGKPDPGVGDFRRANFTGLSILEPWLTDSLPADRMACMVRDGIIPALTAGARVAAFSHSGYWKPMDDIKRVEEAEADIAAGRFRPWK